jgi:hypothetical protein
MLENTIYNQNNKTRIKKKGGTQYASKNYSNPFFTEKKNNNKNNFDWKIKTLSIFIILFFLFFLWFLLYSNYFKIKNIIISGSGQIDKKEIEQMTWNEINNKSFVFSLKNNILFYSDNKIIEQIEKKYTFEELKIKRNNLNTLEIKYTEKKQAFIWLEDGKFYNTDQSGYIISETGHEELKANIFPIIENKSVLRINNKKISHGDEYLNFIFSLIEKYKKYPEFSIEKFILDDSVNLVKTKLVNGPEIYFSTKTDIDKQLDKLIIVKNEKFKDNFKDKQYIDISVGNSIYYK